MQAERERKSNEERIKATHLFPSTPSISPFLLLPLLLRTHRRRRRGLAAATSSSSSYQFSIPRRSHNVSSLARSLARAPWERRREQSRPRTCGWAPCPACGWRRRRLRRRRRGRTWSTWRGGSGRWSGGSCSCGATTSRDVELSPRARARRVVWSARRLRRAAATGLRRLRARLRLCFAWVSRRRNIHRRGARFAATAASPAAPPTPRRPPRRRPCASGRSSKLQSIDQAKKAKLGWVNWRLKQEGNLSSLLLG